MVSLWEISLFTGSVLAVLATVYASKFNWEINNFFKKRQLRNPLVLSSPTTKTVVVSRLHSKRGSPEMSPEKQKDVLNFIENCQSYANAIIICVDVGEKLEYQARYKLLVDITANLSVSSKVEILPVSNWGNYVFALNAGLQRAIQQKFDYIIYQSIEFSVVTSVVEKLFEQSFQPDTLVVGPAMEGHLFAQGTHLLRGRTCPWNTFAIWKVSLLAEMGFPMIADGINGPEFGGVEEVVAVTLLQRLHPRLRAVLMRTTPPSTPSTPAMNASQSSAGAGAWATEFSGDADRRAYHEQKMRSKDERPAAHLRVLGVDGGTVVHIDSSE